MFLSRIASLLNTEPYQAKENIRIENVIHFHDAGAGNASNINLTRCPNIASNREERETDFIFCFDGYQWQDNYLSICVFLHSLRSHAVQMIHSDSLLSVTVQHSLEKLVKTVRQLFVD